MNIFDMILWPFKLAVSAVLWFFHTIFTSIGMDPSSGFTWVLCIICLTLVMRAVTIPLFMRQIKSMRGMNAMQGDLAKLQAKYKGKKDQLSRQAMAQEQMALFKKHGTSPFSSCITIIAQMPIFLGLYQVLMGVSGAAAKNEGILLLPAELVKQFSEAYIFGSPIFSTMMNPGNGNHAATVAQAIIMILLMSGTQFFIQKQLSAKNISEAAKNSPIFRQQQMMMYGFPVIFAVTGINFPLGVMYYWTVSNFWALGQQWWVIRNNPTPGSQAEKELNERRAAKGLPPVGKTKEQHEKELEEARERAAAGQRQQPMSKKRQKQQQRKGGGQNNSGNKNSNKPKLN